MKLHIKAQCLPDTLKDGLSKTLENEISIASEIVPSDESLLATKGSLYAVVNIKSTNKTDLRTLVTLFFENLKDSFYKQDDEPVLQSLERALKRSVNIITTTKPNDKVSKAGITYTGIDVSFCIVVINDRVLYISYLGNPAAYLIKGTSVARNVIDHGNPKEIWTQTNLLLGDEIILIGTEQVKKQFPVDTILTSLPSLSNKIKSSSQYGSLATILLKITLHHHVKQKKISDILSYQSIKTKVSSIYSKIPFSSNQKSLYDQFKIYNSSQKSPAFFAKISSTSSILPSNMLGSGFASDLNIKGSRHYKTLIRSASESTKSYTVKITVLIIITSTILISLKYYFDSNNADLLNQDLISNISTRDDILNLNSTNSDDNDESEVKAIYDLSQISSDINTLGITFLKENNIVILDRNTKSVYQINLLDKSHKKVLENLTNPEYITCKDFLCYVYDTENMYLFNPDQSPRFNKFFVGITDVIDLKVFQTSPYILTSLNIKKVTINSSTQFKVEDYITDGLETPKGLAVDGNTYVISANNVKKYLNTRLDANYKTDADNLLQNATQISIADTNLYILDPSINSVYVVDKNTGDNTNIIELPTPNNTEISMFAVGGRPNPTIYYVADKKLYSNK